MNKDISQYVHRHTLLVTTFILAGFLLLATGEYYLYRKVAYVSRMVSEGLMQIKEANKLKGQAMMKSGRMMMRTNADFSPMQTSLMMPSGMKIMMDGTIVRADGIKVKLEDGQIINIE